MENILDKAIDLRKEGKHKESKELLLRLVS